MLKRVNGGSLKTKFASSTRLSMSKFSSEDKPRIVISYLGSKGFFSSRKNWVVTREARSASRVASQFLREEKNLYSRGKNITFPPIGIEMRF